MGKSLVLKVLDKRVRLNKFSLLTSMFFVFLLSLVAMPSLVPAQVIIKEKVEINPQKNIIPDYPSALYTPCEPGPSQNNINNKWQSIWNGMQYKLDPYQQLFNEQSNLYKVQELNQSHQYRVEIIESPEYAEIMKLGDYDPETEEFTDPEIIGDLLESVTGLELKGTGSWEYTVCNTKEKENPSKYVINFYDDTPSNTVVTVLFTDLSSGEVIYYHTRIAIPTMNFEIEESFDTLTVPHYYSTNLDITLSSDQNSCYACGGTLPSWITFTLEIVNGQEYGSLYNTVTGESGSYFTNILASPFWACSNTIDGYEFIADGMQPDSLNPAVVKIRCTSSDGDIGILERNFYVTYNTTIPVEEGIFVEFVKPQLVPGDTTQINLQRRNSDGSLEDFSEWDSFEIGMIEGCEGGQILYGDSLAPYFSEVYQPIYFVADSSITDTSITVRVRVGLIEGIIGSSRPSVLGGEQTENKTIEKNRSKLVKRPTKKTNSPNPQPDNPVSFCFNGIIDRDKMGDGNGVVGDECDFDNCAELNYENNTIVLNRQPNDFEYTPSDTVKVCDLNDPATTTNDVGQSRPVPTYQRKRKELNWGNSWEIEPCINNDGIIQFLILSPDKIQPANLKFDFIEAVCEDIITNNPNNGNIIRDLMLNGVQNGQDAMKDFCGHQSYPIVSGTPSRGGHYIWQVIRVHEGIHGDRFLKILNTNWIELKKELSKFSLKCEEYNSEYWGKALVEQHIESLLSLFYIKCYDQYFAENNEQEIQCHSEIRELIRQYMKQVNFFYKIKIPEYQCFECTN